MKIPAVIAAFAIVLGLVWWVRHRFQERHLLWLVQRSRGTPKRAQAVTLLPELAALVAACAALVVAVLSEQLWGLFWLRIPLAILVLLLYVPYAAMLAPVRAIPKLRRTPSQRMVDQGASPQVAEAIARTGRPFAVTGTVLMLAAVYVLFWHHISG